MPCCISALLPSIPNKQASKYNSDPAWKLWQCTHKSSQEEHLKTQLISTTDQTAKDIADGTYSPVQKDTDVCLIWTDASEENRFLVYRIRPLCQHALLYAESHVELGWGSDSELWTISGYPAFDSSPTPLFQVVWVHNAVPVRWQDNDLVSWT